MAKPVATKNEVPLSAPLIDATEDDMAMPSNGLTTLHGKEV